MKPSPNFFAEEPEFGLVDPDEERERRRFSLRCTPETLLDFLQRTWRVSHRSPTMKEVKDEFGGIIGSMVMYPELVREGKVVDGKPIGV